LPSASLSEEEMTKTRKLLTVGAVVLIVALTTTALFLSFWGSNSADLTRVACVGDSITQWTEYPTYLQLLLGNQSTVKGFGISGATVVLGSDRPFMNQTAFEEALEFQPTTIVILLGTNDARTNIYRDHIANFTDDYKVLITAFQALPSKPTVFLAKPPPLFNNNLSLSIENLEQGVIPRIEQVAKELDLRTIDVYGVMAGHPEYFVDGVHPNNQGAEAIAKEIHKTIK
jgi:lysophospholipase L1-like esterase